VRLQMTKNMMVLFPLVSSFQVVRVRVRVRVTTGVEVPACTDTNNLVQACTDTRKAYMFKSNSPLFRKTPQHGRRHGLSEPCCKPIYTL
jgi:hypothetical protein